MIFYWVLISYAFVNVSADITYEEYSEEVDITNVLIDKAIAKAARNSKYNKMNHMLAIPDEVDYNNLEVFKENEINMRTAISNVTGLEWPQERRSLDIKILGNLRRGKTTAAVKLILDYDLLRGNYRDYTMDQKCYLVGIAIQKLYIFNHTVSAVIEDDICVLTDFYGKVRNYIEENNQFWEVNRNEEDKIIGRLLDQI